MAKLTREQENEINKILNEEIIINAPKSSKSQAQQIFDLANSFQYAAIRCSEEIYNTTGGTLTATSPAICNYAFACELYLKSFILDDGHPIHGHNLKSLFLQVNEKTQRKTRRSYSRLTTRNVDEFNDDLASLSKVFVDWRYIYEKERTALSVGRLIATCRSLYATAKKIRTDWVIQTELDNQLCQEPNVNIVSIISLGSGIMVRAVYKPS